MFTYLQSPKCKWSDEYLLVQRLVVTKADLEGGEAPRKQEGRVIQPI